MGVPRVGHPTLHARRDAGGLHVAALDASQEPAVAATEVLQALFAEPYAAVGKHREPDEVDANGGAGEPVFVGMDVECDPRQAVPQPCADGPQFRPRLPKDEKVVHVADVAAGPHDFRHEMVERVEHHVGEELARQVADRQARATSGTARFTLGGDLSACPMIPRQKSAE